MTASKGRQRHRKADTQHSRVPRACERCRIRKTKCDALFPCKRCRNDGYVCAVGARKKPEYKQLPEGYTEMLESTHIVLIAAIQKLYSMVRNGEPWELEDPDHNDHGEPIIHDIVAKLDFVRPGNDIYVSTQCMFPEDKVESAAGAFQMTEQSFEIGRGSIDYCGNAIPSCSHSLLNEKDSQCMTRGDADTESINTVSQGMTYNEFDIFTENMLFSGEFRHTWSTYRRSVEPGDISSQHLLFVNGAHSNDFREACAVSPSRSTGFGCHE